jgi:hypothetical protein
MVVEAAEARQIEATTHIGDNMSLVNVMSFVEYPVYSSLTVLGFVYAKILNVFILMGKLQCLTIDKK